MPYLGHLFSPPATPQAKHDGRTDRSSKYDDQLATSRDQQEFLRKDVTLVVMIYATQKDVDTQRGVGGAFVTSVVDWWKW
jgi:hypothetical protein